MVTRFINFLFERNKETGPERGQKKCIYRTGADLFSPLALVKK